MALFRRKQDDIDETLPALRTRDDDDTMPTADVPDWFDAPVEELPPLPPIRRRRRGRRNNEWDPWLSDEAGQATSGPADDGSHAESPPAEPRTPRADEEWMRQQIAQPTSDRSPLDATPMSDAAWSEALSEPRDDGEWNQRRYPGAVAGETGWSSPRSAAPPADPWADPGPGGLHGDPWSAPPPPIGWAESRPDETPVDSWTDPPYSGYTPDHTDQADRAEPAEAALPWAPPPPMERAEATPPGPPAGTDIPGSPWGELADAVAAEIPVEAPVASPDLTSDPWADPVDPVSPLDPVDVAEPVEPVATDEPAAGPDDVPPESWDDPVAVESWDDPVAVADPTEVAVESQDDPVEPVATDAAAEPVEAPVESHDDAEATDAPDPVEPESAPPTVNRWDEWAEIPDPDEDDAADEDDDVPTGADEPVDEPADEPAGSGPDFELVEEPAPGEDSEADDGAPLDPTSDVLPALVEDGPLSAQLLDIKNRARDELSARLGARLYDRAIREDQLESLIIEELGRFLYEQDVVLSELEQERLAEGLIDDVLRHGPIEAYLQDPTVTEIMVNSTDAIYIERGGRLFITESRFTNEGHLRQVIERIAGTIGRRIDESSPMVDARLPDGSRVNAIIPPLAVDGSAMTIRKFAKDRMTVDDLLEMGTMTPQVGAFIAACVRGRMNILVTGGTGSGKTTLLNVLSSYIPASERIVSIEDAVELQMHQRHVIRLESRPPNVEGRGQITIRDLVRNALRMRPDRIVIGEVRGGEALDMLQAMNTGHDGSLSTLHANSPRDGLRRVETMVLMAGVDLPIKFVREQVASAVDMIVHLARLRDGTRRITHISEVSGMETDVITLNDIFRFDFSAGVGPDGRFLGQTVPSGVRPGFLDRLEDQGIAVPASIFSPDGDDARGTRW